MLPAPPGWPREFSLTPRSKTCGISLISRSVETAVDRSISSRPSAIIAEPTGAVPRSRVPVTMISLKAEPAAGVSVAWSWAKA